MSVAAVLTERGFIYSVGHKRFVTSSNNDVFLAEKDRFPNKFELVEMKGSYSGSLTVYPVPRIGDKVMDLSLSGKRVIYLYPKHENWNQQITVRMMPKGMIRLMIWDYCLTVDNGVLIQGTCKTSDDDKNQLFRWVPETREREVRNFIYRNRRDNYRGNYSRRPSPRSSRPGPSNRRREPPSRMECPEFREDHRYNSNDYPDDFDDFDNSDRDRRTTNDDDSFGEAYGGGRDGRRYTSGDWKEPKINSIRDQRTKNSDDPFGEAYGSRRDKYTSSDWKEPKINSIRDQRTKNSDDPFGEAYGSRRDKYSSGDWKEPKYNSKDDRRRKYNDDSSDETYGSKRDKYSYGEWKEPNADSKREAKKNNIYDYYVFDKNHTTKSNSKSRQKKSSNDTKTKNINEEESDFQQDIYEDKSKKNSKILNDCRNEQSLKCNLSEINVKTDDDNLIDVEDIKNLSDVYKFPKLENKKPEQKLLQNQKCNNLSNGVESEICKIYGTSLEFRRATATPVA